jgi:hypothetical protein
MILITTFGYIKSSLFMKTSIFVIALIVVVCMAGALIINIAYQKRSESKKTPTTDLESYRGTPTAFAISYNEYTADVASPLFKPIVMDLGLSNAHPF